MNTMYYFFSLNDAEELRVIFINIVKRGTSPFKTQPKYETGTLHPCTEQELDCNRTRNTTEDH
jgi:hypothetical protein